MITIDLGVYEYYDDYKQEFVKEEGGLARFEYSLKVIYEWEGRWKKPFLKGELTEQEAIDFYKLMAIDPIDEKFLTIEVIEILTDYVKDQNTATTFSSPDTGQNGSNFKKPSKIHTAEEIYALMFSAGVPLEFENRNFSRLMIILRIIESYNKPPKKMSRNDILRQNSTLNAQRKAKMKSKG